VFARAVAQIFEDLAAFEKSLAFGDEAFEFDRAHLAAILFGLGASLAVFVVVQGPLHAARLAVKEVGEMPGEIVEVILEAAATEDGGQTFKQEIEALIELVRIGKRAGIGLILMGVITMDLQFFDDAGGWREGRRGRRSGF
jgi:hypothetical protein